MIDGVSEQTLGLEPILEEVRVLERLVEDLRTLSLADAGQLALHLETVDLGALAADVAARRASRDRRRRDPLRPGADPARRRCWRASTRCGCGR